MKSKLLILLSLFAFVGGAKAQTWTWTGEGVSAKTFYLYNQSLEKFVKIDGTSSSLVTEPEDGCKVKFTKDSNNDKYFMQNSNDKYITWGNNNYDLNLNNDKKNETVRVLGFIPINLNYSYNFTSSNGSSTIHYASTSDGNFYLYVNNNNVLAKGKDASLNRNWKFITSDEVTKRGQYRTAYKDVSEYIASYSTKLITDKKNELTNNHASANYANDHISALGDLKTALMNEVAIYDKSQEVQAYITNNSGKFATDVQATLNAYCASPYTQYTMANMEALLAECNRQVAAYNDTNNGIRNVHFNDDIYFWQTDGDGFYIKQDEDSRLNGRVAECWVDGNSTEKNTKTASIFQVVSGLTPGYYTLSANCIGGHGDTQDYLYVTVGEQTYSSVVPGVDGDPSTIATSVTFYTDGSDVTVGFKKNGTKWWSAIDDVTLTPESNFQATYTRENLTKGSYGTICLPYAVSSENFVGAAVYKIAGKRVNESGVATSIVFDEVTDLEAGVPYIFIAEGTKITATYTLGAKAIAGKSEKGLHGTLVRYAFADDADYSEGEYYIVNSKNQFQKAAVESGVIENRAFVKISEVPEYTEGEEGANEVKIMRDNLETGLDAVEMNSTRVVYDLKGRRVNNPANGLYIVNGKKMFIK